MKRFQYIFSLVVLSITVFSCSQEKQLERRLTGAWDIDRIEWSQSYVDTASSLDPITESQTNVGSMVFLKGGRGSSVIQTTEREEALDFKWSNSEREVVIFNKDVIQGTLVESRIYNVVQSSRRSMVLGFSETRLDVDPAYIYSAEIYMTKRRRN